MTLLREAVRRSVAPSPAREAGLPDGLAARVNWNHLLWLAKRHDVLLMVRSAIQGALPGQTPPEVIAWIEDLRQVNQIRLLGRGREVCLLQDLFDSHGIRVIAVSGWALGQKYYREPVLRELGGRTNILVDPAMHAKAAAVLTEAGYKLGEDPLRLEERGRSNVNLSQPSGLASMTPSEAWDSAWSAAEPFPNGGRVLRILCRADWIARLAVRGPNHLWLQLRRTADFAALVCGASATEWTHCLERASTLGAERAVLLAVATSHRILNLPLPEPVESRLAHSSGLSRTANRIASKVARGTTTPGRFTALRIRLALMGSLPARLRLVARNLRTLHRSRSVPDVDPDSELAYAGRYSPTPPPVVQTMLRLAGTTSSDVVCDLGCGDGRVVIAAVEKFGARAIGIDIDPARIAEATANAAAKGISNGLTLTCGDALKAPIGDATVVCLYLQGFTYPVIRRKLERELRPGTRVVSHTFIFPEWPPERTELVRSGPMRMSLIYLWRIGTA